MKRVKLLHIYIIANIALFMIILNKILKYDMIKTLQFTSIFFMCSFIACYFIVGEKILRHIKKVNVITNVEVSNRIYPLFFDVCDDVKEQFPSLAEDISLYIIEDENPRATAIGRKSIAITNSLLEKSNREISGALAHALGQIVNKDYHYQMCTLACNGAFNLFGIYLLALGLYSLFLELEHILLLWAGLAYFGYLCLGRLYLFFWECLIKLIFTTVKFLIIFWNKFATLILVWDKRIAVYEADLFAVECGYGGYLYLYLYNLDGYYLSILDMIFEGNPNIDKRLERIEDKVFTSHEELDYQFD